jgi:hypothetical protein
MYDPRTMKRLALVLFFAAGAWSQERAPFTLSIVPSESSAKEGAAMEITRKPNYAGQVPSVDTFYLVLTNVSAKPQPVFEFRNSWGTYAISLEIKMQDGKKYIARYRGIFTMNYPSTFLVQPEEHMVYPMRLDGWWAPEPELPKTEYLPVTLKAIYKIEPLTPEEEAGTDESDKEVRSV